MNETYGYPAANSKSYGAAQNSLAEYQRQAATNASIPPQEPALMSKAEELLKHVSGLEREHERLRDMLFGPRPEAEAALKCNPAANGISGMLADACSRVACMVGDMATINGKIG